MLSGVWFLAPSVEQTPREKFCHITPISHHAHYQSGFQRKWFI